MSNYLNQLVAKSFNLTDMAQPLILSMFEPIPESAGMVGVADSNWEQQIVSSEESQLETEWDTWISTISAIEEPWESQLPPTIDSGRSLETPTPEELSYQESPNLTPAFASHFEELQSTDLIPASFTKSEELLNFASQLPEQVNSEQSPSETLSQPVFIEPATEKVLFNPDRQKLTPAIEVETNFSQATPLVELKAQPTSESDLLIESHRVVSRISQQEVTPNSHIIPPSADVETLASVETIQITSRQRDDDSWQQSAHQPPPESAVISPMTHNPQSTTTRNFTKAIATPTIVPPVKSAPVPQLLPKSESKKLIETHRVVSTTPSPQVVKPLSHIIAVPPDVETLLGVDSQLATSTQSFDRNWQQLANPLLPQSAFISPTTENLQSTSHSHSITAAIALGAAPCRSIAKQTDVSLENSHIKPLHLPTPESSKNRLIEVNPIASFSQLLEEVSSNTSRLYPLLQDVDKLHLISQKVLPTEERQPLTSANAQRTNFLSASPLTQPPQKQNDESFQNQPIKIHRVASSSQLPEMEKLNSHIKPPSAPNVKTLYVTSLQDSDMTSQLSLNQLQLLSGEILLPTKRIQSTPDREPLTPANAWETNVPLAIPAAIPRQEPATKFLENSPVQINISPETNTALSNSVPEPELQSAPELSGVQLHVVNRVVSSPQLPILAPLPQQYFFETGDAPRSSSQELVHTVSTLNTPRKRQRDFSQELNGFEQMPSMSAGLVDGNADVTTSMIHPKTATPVVQSMESFASSDLPNSRTLESRTNDEQLSSSQYTGIIQQSLEKIIHWKDVGGQGADSAVETSPQKLEHLIGLHLQEKFRNSATPPNIKVSIGRVEIRATQQTKPALPKPRPMPLSVMSLDEYLRRRAQGGRR